LNGIDVSNNNDIRDWNVLKQQGVQTAIQKATQGVDYTDPLFEYRYPRIKQAGIKFGVYHFAGGLHPAEQEAEHFINAIKGKQLDTVCFLDIENYSTKTFTKVWQYQEAIDFCNKWFAYVKSKGYKVGLYTGEYFYDSLLKSHIPADVPLWIASYGKQPSTYPSNSWQYTGTGKLNGAIGNLDLDIFTDNIFIKANETEVFDMKKVVTYLGDADVFAALMVSQKNACPLMRKTDYEASGLKAGQVIQIGGKPNSTRWSTFKDAANLV